MSLRDIRFLVIEDQPFQRTMLRQMLIGMGAETVHSAQNGKHAIRLLQDPLVMVDIVISDLAMPEMDGIELLSGLPPAHHGLSLIFLSGSPSNLEAAEQLASAAGFDVLGAVVKPISPSSLTALIAPYQQQRRDGKAHNL